MNILITGFMPFGRETVNSSYEAVKRLPQEILGCRIRKLEIPVVFGEGASMVFHAVREETPDAVLCVGQAGGRTAISIERVALNLAECRPDFPDNAGNCPGGEPIIPNGPAAYFATLPVKEMEARVLKLGIPAELSCTAGTYVCNDVMYRLLHLLDHEYQGTRGGFVHVPYLPSQAAGHPGRPSMAEEDMVRGLEACIEAVILTHNAG
ncbi:pyroglutamyl-peptidase I [Lachnotalea sp. AF33-28]|uniref:pyroglutamyl-peptidase I n=1 Tax=Lachnotalea sp. AF33-28 TaxID=2292046 RepID=UPI000E530DAB|nr:pyroglutamyl-peptidase I [Lachnotalea sp. AF33-28]RHP35710.1 pyroglutamyl-peptidase I [Lachnotalea sp. AF33-28]